MMYFSKWLTLGLLLSLVLISQAYAFADKTNDQATTPTEEEKIGALLDRFGKSGGTYIRNDKEYPAEKAAIYLRMKWEKKGKVANAREFVKRIASFSEQSGRPYMFRKKNGQTVKLGDWLTEQLDEIGGKKIEDTVEQKTEETLEQQIERALEIILKSELTFQRIHPYSGPHMARHIERKYKWTKDDIDNFDDFVEKCAGRSWTYGTDYRVKLPDGKETPLRDWLKEQMQKKNKK